MSKFKWKNNKENKILNPTTTLDKTHRNIMSAFHIEEEELNILSAESEMLLDKINNHEFKSNADKKNAQETIAKTKNKMIQFKKRKHKYILDNSNLIFKYFNIKKTTENASSSSLTIDSDNKPLNFNQQRFRNFFLKKTLDNAAQIKTKSATNEGNASIISKYLSNVDVNYISTNASINSSVNNICMYCTRGNLLISDDDGYLVCNVCAASITYIPENEKQSYNIYINARNGVVNQLFRFRKLNNKWKKAERITVNGKIIKETIDSKFPDKQDEKNIW
jgi:hypothetical protein